MGLFSTPTNEGDSRIDVAYKTGTQEEWRHQCPNCDEFHKLSYTDMEVEAVKGPKVQGMQTYRVKASNGYVQTAVRVHGKTNESGSSANMLPSGRKPWRVGVVLLSECVQQPLD